MTSFLVPGVVLGNQIKNLVTSLEIQKLKVESIRLRSCRSAVGGGASQAQCVADITGKMVVGYKGAYQMYGCRSPSAGGSGTTRVFYPHENPHISALAQAGNFFGCIPVSMGVAIITPYKLIAKAVRRINARVQRD